MFDLACRVCAVTGRAFRRGAFSGFSEIFAWIGGDCICAWFKALSWFWDFSVFATFQKASPTPADQRSAFRGWIEPQFL